MDALVYVKMGRTHNALSSLLEKIGGEQIEVQEVNAKSSLDEKSFLVRLRLNTKLGSDSIRSCLSTVDGVRDLEIESV
jgi:hypothetical protein